MTTSIREHRDIPLVPVNFDELELDGCGLDVVDHLSDQLYILDGGLGYIHAELNLVIAQVSVGVISEPAKLSAAASIGGNLRGIQHLVVGPAGHVDVRMLDLERKQTDQSSNCP